MTEKTGAKDTKMVIVGEWDGEIMWRSETAKERLERLLQENIKPIKND